ncbi:methyltransferase domain-containing protein [Neobacillus sp. PS3-40]|uniref:class I SAM-dependent methyltransferase n=1 Tax=Neobacillus sp. PS3-40 TaxID=3070679 RepID=UPI0027DF023D|nr:methyltransferase domain-containing protein [Neobacillus sp. PS3-40]WML44035.1 methyltransferase domain-containing protein [Neobacillus sp. PS3-40]
MSDKSVSENVQFVSNYLNLIGLKASCNNQEFWEHLERNHEEDILDQLDQAFQKHNEGDSDAESLYEFKNQNLKLSLDVSNFSTDLYKSYFEWFTNYQIKAPNKILDLGCDNGIVTCFYAMLFPHSDIIGIDIHGNAIKCANELARNLNLPNISFLTMDFNDIQEYFPENSFNLITSLRSFHEIIGEFPDVQPPWSKEDLDSLAHQNEQAYLLNLIRPLLKDEESKFITCERLSGKGSIALWAILLKNAGLHVTFEESDFIEFHEIGQEQQMPVLIAGQQKTNTTIIEGIYGMFENGDF